MIGQTRKHVGVLLFLVTSALNVRVEWLSKKPIFATMIKCIIGLHVIYKII